MTKPARPAAPEQDAPLDLGSALGGLACTHMALRQAARRLGALYDDAVAETGLKATQVGLMVKIEGLRDPALQDLAQAAAIGLSSLTYALRPLVRDGLVVLTPNAADRRTKHAALTASS
jgi:DNA-binding MarR family transcriptional regulator